MFTQLSGKFYVFASHGCANVLFRLGLAVVLRYRAIKRAALSALKKVWYLHISFMALCLSRLTIGRSCIAFLLAEHFLWLCFSWILQFFCCTQTCHDLELASDKGFFCWSTAKHQR